MPQDVVTNDVHKYITNQTSEPQDKSVCLNSSNDDMLLPLYCRTIHISSGKFSVKAFMFLTFWPQKGKDDYNFDRESVYQIWTP